MSDSARIDPNFNTTLIGVSSEDHETPELLEVNPNSGRLLVDATDGMTPGSDYDRLDVEQTSSTVETYTFRLGGASGDIVRTIVITYTDSTKETIANVEWS